MPAQKAKSGLMAKYGAKLDKAVQDHAADPIDYGYQRLPGGILGGIARLDKCYFDIYKDGKNKGEYYFRATGIVVSPKSVSTPSGEMQVEGLVTSIMHPVCDTAKSNGEPVSQDQHVADILNEMKKLGADTEGASGADLETLAAALQESKPYFRFKTEEGKATPQYPTPRVFENWLGNKGLEDYTADESPGGGVQDDTDGGGDEPPTKDTESDEAPGDHELDELVEKANAEDEDAINRLVELAREAGIDDETITGAEGWSEVADMIRGAGGDDEEEVEEEEEEEGPRVPAKGDPCNHKVIDPKTKKPAINPKTKKLLKPVACEVVAVDKKTETVTLKNLDDGKTLYKGIPFADLIWDD